jgi:4-hydroxyphenylacetate 3-monooxygenase
MTGVVFDVIGGPAVTLSDFQLVIAGYTARDQDALRAHVNELAAIGIPAPESVPSFCPIPAGLLTHSVEITVAGARTSGEAEPVLVRHDGRLYLTVGSDHTDRDLQRTSLFEAKAACAKPVSRVVVPLSPDVDWDSIELASRCDGHRYQEGRLTELLPPVETLERFPADGDVVLFCGTLPLLDGQFVAGHEWEMTLAMPHQQPLSVAYRATQRT